MTKIDGKCEKPMIVSRNVRPDTEGMKKPLTPGNPSPAPLQVSLREAMGPGFQQSSPAGVVLNAAANEYRNANHGVRY